MVREAIRWGASGFVEKTAEPAEIRAALVAAARSQRYLSPGMANLADSSVMQDLTPREMDVLALLTRGDCNKLISSLHPNWR
jgi:two-component system NarL family response regulator